MTTPAVPLNLRDWHLPDPVSWWPPAPGWWLLGGIVLLTLLLFYLGWRWWRNRASTRAALRQLAALQTILAADGDVRQFAIGVSQLLRRLALTRFPPFEVAGLTGTAWLAFLDATGGNGGFTGSAAGHLLIEAAYRTDATGDPEPLRQLAAAWIRQSRKSPR
ncbi:DUF4381 domain-containing protein [Chromatium okenii]|jgi:hypothetical protein|uniref:DUF4381 domain-containing protein n=1 Tax=Chromatium okenii TaxID=61644 RepID=A0A2S7XTS2_9GAMM|nr:DUF4381 domain-containing protein [Chromatium okenii]PQJ97139.1 DUF4381 domain-containing protein [Chromatium okenii]